MKIFSHWKKSWYLDFLFTVLMCCLITMTTVVCFVAMEVLYNISFFILFPSCIVLLILEIELTCQELVNILKSERD